MTLLELIGDGLGIGVRLLEERLRGFLLRIGKIQCSGQHGKMLGAVCAMVSGGLSGVDDARRKNRDGGICQKLLAECHWNCLLDRA